MNRKVGRRVEVVDRKMEDETCSYTTARADEARTLKAPFTTVDERRRDTTWREHG